MYLIKLIFKCNIEVYLDNWLIMSFKTAKIKKLEIGNYSILSLMKLCTLPEITCINKKKLSLTCQKIPIVAKTLR